jgi:hypothetical protein
MMLEYIGRNFHTAMTRMRTSSRPASSSGANAARGAASLLVAAGQVVQNPVQGQAARIPKPVDSAWV